MTTPAVLGELKQLLRSCVQCGLCLPTCATWAATGNEVLSPRGRLVLMESLLAEGGKALDPGDLQAFDQCIGCRACETACPSGVPFSLFEYGKMLAAKSRRAGSLPHERLSVPNWLLHRLDRPAVLRVLKALAPLAVAAPPSVARLAQSLPTAPERDQDLMALLARLTGGGGVGPARFPRPTQDDGIEVSFFSGCANAGLMPGTSRRLAELLCGCGCLVRIPAAQGCCGALAAHTGRYSDRKRLHDQNRRAFGGNASRPWIVVEAAGCGAELKEQMDFGGAEILDATEALGRLILPTMRSVPLKVVYHAACHLEHGQQVREQPRALLRGIPGLELVEPEDAALCCGSGGVWSLEHPDLAAEIGRQKARALLDTGAQLIVTTNPGCLGQIRGALAALGEELPIIPLSDLIWYACMT